MKLCRRIGKEENSTDLLIMYNNLKESLIPYLPLTTKKKEIWETFILFESEITLAGTFYETAL